MARSALLLLLVAALAACEGSEATRADPPRPAAPVARQPPSPMPAETTAGPAYLIWLDRGGADGGYETVWFAPEADPPVLHERRGIYVATDEHLWTWETASLDLRQLDCECAQRFGDSPPEGERMSEACGRTSQLRSRALMTADGTRGLSAVRNVRFRRGQADNDLSFQPLGSVGSLWFAKVCYYSIPCGAANGSTSCRPFIADLSEIAPVELVDLLGGEEEMARLEERLGRAAENRLRRNWPSSRDQQPAGDPTDPKLVHAWPVVEYGELRMNYLFAAPISRAGSDGRWDSYTFSTTVTTRRLPETMSAYQPMPPAVLDFLERHSRRDFAGFSRLPDDAEQRRRMWRQFHAL